MNKQKQINFIIFLLAFVIIQINSTVYAIQDTPKKQEKNNISLEKIQEKKLVSKIDFESIWDKAKEHSYDLKIADFNILISKQDIRGARSEYFPKLIASAGTEYTKNYRDNRDTTVMSIGESFINPYTRYQSIMGITLTYNLFDFGVRKGNLDIAKEDVVLKELEQQDKIQELNLNLVDTYSKILITQKQIELNKKILDLENKNLQAKERLFNAGELSKTELNDEKVKIEKVKQKINELCSMYEESLNWLSFYTGEEYNTNNLKVVEIKKPDFDVTEFRDYTKSIKWRMKERELMKKELEIKVAKRTNYPKVNAYGRYYIYGSDPVSYNDNLGDIRPSNFTVGASISMLAFDGMKNRSNIQKKILEYKQLQVERDKSIAELMMKLANMRSNLIYLDKQVDNNKKIIKELTDKQKSIHRLVAKQLATPLEENDANIGTVTIKDALKSKKDVSISVGKVSQGTLENAIQDQLKFDQNTAKKGQKMNGTVFNDTFIGSDYNDKIYTGAGNDTITAGKGNDTINITGAGNKTITIANGDGNDVITGIANIAKADKVTLSGLTEEKLSYAKSGNDLVITRDESEKGDGSLNATTTIKDYFKDSKNAGKLAGVTVDNVAVTGKGKIVGSFKNDVITGSDKNDKIYTGAGDDTIKSGKGNDTIFIDGAGKKTINIANHDGNDVITGVRTEGASVDLKINGTDKLSYSKNGTSNDLIITRSYTEQLTNKKGEKLYTDVVTGRQTTETAVKGTEATGEFWSKTDGGEIITKAAYDKLASKDGYKKVEVDVYSTKDSKGNVSYITKTAYDKLASDAQTGYNKETNTVYSYGSGKNLTYSTDATKENTALTKDYTETTTVKDFFKDGEGASNVTVNDSAIDLNGLTISGQNIMGTKYNDVIYGSNKNDVIIEQAGNNTFNIGVKGSTVINSAGASSNDIYNVKNLNTSVDIYDNGGKDALNINVKDMKAEALRYVFDVDKTGAKGDLIITDTKGINSSKFNGVAINDYFTTQVTVPDTSNEEEGATKVETVDHKVETINLNGSSITDSSITDNVATSIANITNDVKNFLNANKYESASDVFDGKDRKAKAELKEIYNSGNNKYNFSTVEGNANQTVTDKIGDSDIYNVDNKFDFTKDKLVISDSQGENDVLNLAQKADDLTILFDIKKSPSEAESAVGDALYVIGKGQTNLDHGIQMSGIDTIKTSDGKGGYTDITAPTNAIVSAVQSWLEANSGKGYDSVADAIKASDDNLADLIAKFAPSQPQA